MSLLAPCCFARIIFTCWNEVAGRLLHNHTHPHAVLRTQQLLQVFDHPINSPDLSSSDYHLFQHMKRFLAKQHLASEDVHRLDPLSDGGSVRHWCTEMVSWYGTRFISGDSHR
ncbi:hypothetical protein AVEN_69094-1 [Araneus ventricosus]|uniref:Uncharacterized protein n=1 Tax=Araneus ventricosus TaxID=182803 RepID=A0A4Y2PKA2_ARAVE|nr:hypothetical protein AVEN_69094-1 [Araneus ventricosus]